MAKSNLNIANVIACTFLLVLAVAYILVPYDYDSLGIKGYIDDYLIFMSAFCLWRISLFPTNKKQNGNNIDFTRKHPTAATQRAKRTLLQVAVLHAVLWVVYLALLITHTIS